MKTRIEMAWAVLRGHSVAYKLVIREQGPLLECKTDHAYIVGCDIYGSYQPHRGIWRRLRDWWRKP